MASKELQILYEDQDVIVCIKPAGVPSQGDRTGAYDLTSQILNHLAQRKGQKESREVPYLAVVHRLDRPVGGVIVYAKTKKAATELSRQVREHEMTKRYFCVLTGCGEKAEIWQPRVDYIAVDKRTNLSRIVEKSEKNAQRAELSWRELDVTENLHLAEVELVTGRHHQIRVQMTRVAEGLWGDTKYNPVFQGKKGWFDLALFAHELEFAHPVAGEPMRFTAVPDGEVFQKFSYIQRLRER